MCKESSIGGGTTNLQEIVLKSFYEEEYKFLNGNMIYCPNIWISNLFWKGCVAPAIPIRKKGYCLAYKKR